MNLWYKKALVFVAAGISYLVGQYFRGVWFNPSWPFPCQEIHSGSVIYCNAPYLETLGWPLIILGQVLVVIAFILLFANARIFRVWLKFSLYYVPVATALTFWLYPTTTPLGGVVPISQGVIVFGWLYAILTFLIVLIQSARSYWHKRHSL